MNAPPPTKTITIRKGQAVPWDASPTGYAQIEDLHRTCVTIGYRDRGGHWRRRRVKAVAVAAQPMLLPLENPFDRGVLPREREFELKGRLT